MKRGLIIFGAIILILAWLFFIGGKIYFQNYYNPSGNVISESETNTPSEDNSNPNINSLPIPANTESSGKGSESKESSSSSTNLPQTENPDNQEICFNKQIAYSITQFKYQLNNNQLNCSLILSNLDNETSGNFQIKIKLIENEEEINSQLFEQYLTPNQKQYLGIIFENANENSICKYETIEIPKKQECYY